MHPDEADPRIIPQGIIRHVLDQRAWRETFFPLALVPTGTDAEPGAVPFHGALVRGGRNSLRPNQLGNPSES